MAIIDLEDEHREVKIKNKDKTWMISLIHDF